jgi:hypothetical protein
MCVFVYVYIWHSYGWNDVVKAFLDTESIHTYLLQDTKYATCDASDKWQRDSMMCIRHAAGHVGSAYFFVCPMGTTGHRMVSDMNGRFAKPHHDG